MKSEQEHVDFKELESELSRLKPNQTPPGLIQSLKSIEHQRRPQKSTATSGRDIAWIGWGAGIAAALTLLLIVAQKFPLQNIDPDNQANSESQSNTDMQSIASEPSESLKTQSIPVAIEELGVLDLRDGAPIQFIRMRTLDFSITEASDGEHIVRTQPHEQILPVRMNYY